MDTETLEALNSVKASVKSFNKIIEVMETAKEKDLKRLSTQLKTAEVDICNAVLRLEYVLDIKEK